MLLDSGIAAETRNVTRRINRAHKREEPVIRGDRPWEEGIALIFGSALYDAEEERFKMWYMCGGGHTAYAVSEDGLSWEKPELEVVVRDGQRTNIVIERGRFDPYYEICGVIEDPEDPDPGRRYKAGFVSIERDYRGEHEDPYHRGSRRGFGTAVSADGVHWTMERDFASYAVCDISHWARDEESGRYVLYGRTKLTPEKEAEPWRAWGWGRAVVRIESEDFRNWSEPELVLAADAEDPEGTEIYSMSVFPYGDLHIGLVQMFYGLPDQGNLDIQLATSRDGRHFSRVEPREPFIPEGGVGTWDRFNVSLGSLAPIAVGDELWFYYGARTYRHSPYSGADSGPSSGSIGLAAVKQGRFAALEASFDGGEVLTKPVKMEQGRLALNANAAFGSIRVELVDEQGKGIPGWKGMVNGQDDVAIPVAFGAGEPGQLAGKDVCLRFVLENAQLFDFAM